MKKLFLFIAVVVFFAMSVKASETDPVKPTAELRAEMVQIIGTNCDYWVLTNNNEITAEVLFTINSHNEIVILSVESEYPNAEKHIASRLNYKKLKTNVYQRGIIYKMPMKIVEDS